MGLILAGLALNELRNMYKRYSGQADAAKRKMNRLRKAREALLPEKQDFSSKITKVDKVADNKAKWKGDTRKAYDDRVEFLLKEMKAREKKLDEYCATLNKLALRAERDAGHYLPIAAEIRTAIQNWTD